MFSALQITFLVYLLQILVHHCTYQISTFSSHGTKNYLKYVEYLVECGPGEYINLCGECVSGHTEKDDDFGKDSCGICGGLETCRRPCSDPMDILDADEDMQGCIKLISMAPNVLDLAESINGSICIFGDGISPDTVADVDCVILKEGQPVVSIEGQVLENKIDLKFPLPSKEGNYDLYCNTSLGIEFKQTVLVVNSNNLIPTSSDKPSLITWVENMITLNVGNIAGPGDLLCFATTASKELLFSEWTGLVSGNSFSSAVQCPSFVPIRPGDVEFGVAYSALGLKTAKTLKLVGLVVAPKPLTAVFKPDIAEIIVTFNQNLEEGDVKDCLSIFTSETMSLLGNASGCYATANEIHIKLRGTVMKNNSTLTFKDHAVKTMFSTTGGGGSVIVSIEDSRTPVRLEGNKRLCSGEQSRLEISSDRQTVGTPSWKVAANRSDISPGQRQRLNLLAWRAARASKANPAAIDINSTSMTSGVRYTIKAIANDSTGTERQAVAEVILSGSGDTWLELDGPTSADVWEYLFFRATLRSCGTSPQPTKYKWEVSSESDKVDTFFVNGHQLRLAPGTLRPGAIYRLSAEAFIGDRSVASESIQVETYLQNFHIRLEDAKIVVGNGHSIEIDGSKATSVSKAIKLKWVCKQGFCSLPGKDKTPLTSLETFSQPFLRIPAKTLALGRYLFALEASLGNSIIDEAEVELVIVSGQPPRMSSLTTQDDKDHFLLQLQVTEILQSCRLLWSVVPRLGYSYLDIEQKPVTVEGSPTRPNSVSMKLVIAKDSLIPGSKIMVKASADCDRAAQSYREFRFFVPEDLNGATLTVEPTEGRALETQFVFRLVERKGAGRVVYSFGYEGGTGDVQMLYSGGSKEFMTYLGCCNVKTVARVCRTRFDCAYVYGPELRLTQPESLNSSILKYFANSYKELIMNMDYKEALANLMMVIRTLKGADQEAYDKFSEDVQKALSERIQVYAERLKSNKDSLEDSVRMLDAASSVMTSMSLSEDTMATVLKFKDLVHSSARSINEKMYEKKISANLPSEPRQTNENGNGLRRKRSTDHSANNSINAAEGALNAAVLYMRKLGNSSETARKERSKLLDLIFYYSTKQCRVAETGLRGVESKITSGNSLNENLERHKREVEDPMESTVKQVEAVLKPTILSIQQMANNSLNVLMEKKKLIGYIVEYSRHMCYNLTTREIVGKGQGLVLLGIIPLNAGEKEKIKFPFCTNWCPNMTNFMNVNVVDFIANSNTTARMCVAIASITDDILTNYSLPANTSGAIRRSAIYWLNVMSLDRHRSEPSYNASSYSKPVGKAVIQVPVWPESKSNMKRLECWHFNGTSWNNTSCVKMKKVSNENITSIKCQCPFPGFYSIFAVDDVKPDQVQVIAGKNKSTPSTSAPKTSTPSAATTNVTTGSTPTATTSNVTTTRTVQTIVPPNNATTTSDINTTASTNNATSTVTNNTSSPGNGSTSNVVPIRNRTSAPSPSVVVVTTQSVISTVPSVFQPYKFSATFRINESYMEEVGDMKEKFEEHIEDQLQKNLNMSESVTVNAQKVKDKITLTLQIQESKLEEAGPSISLLKDQLKNGTLLLTDLKGAHLNIPPQDIVLTQQGDGAKSAITVFVTIVFVFLVILIGSVLAALYLRNTREQRSFRITEDLRPDPPAPKYLRLHDSVSLDSSGPSTPQPAEMESSLAVLTKPHRRGYETMETFSHFPGNI